jgi:hypothetical protein
MPFFEVSAWPAGEAEREQLPIWLTIVESASISEACVEGEKLFQDQFPELEHSEYVLRTSSAY